MPCFFVFLVEAQVSKTLCNANPSRRISNFRFQTFLINILQNRTNNNNNNNNIGSPRQLALSWFDTLASFLKSYRIPGNQGGYLWAMSEFCTPIRWDSQSTRKQNIKRSDSGFQNQPSYTLRGSWNELFNLFVQLLRTLRISNYRDHYIINPKQCTIMSEIPQKIPYFASSWIPPNIGNLMT